MKETSSIEDDDAIKGSSSCESEYDIETYRHAIEEARRTWDQHLDAYNDIAEKSWRIIRLNGIVVTIYIAAVANAISNLEVTLSGLEIDLVPVAIVVGGLASIGYSTAVALVKQQSEKVKLGQGPEAFESVREHKPKEIVYLHQTLETHSNGIKQVAEKTEENAVPVNRAYLFSIGGVGLLTIGTLLGIVL